MFEAMAGRYVERLADLPAEMHDVVATSRRAVLSTVDRRGRPHSVPVVFAIFEESIVTPIDRKPKTTKALGRRKNIGSNPQAALLCDRWSEEWTELAWVMIRGSASEQEAERSEREVEAIVARHPRYRDVLQGSDIIRIVPERISWWSWRE
jgi:PPOX class probable F420-dependent enzyme